MTTLNSQNNELKTDTREYEVIENSRITDQNYKSESISGALLSLTTFENVIFEDCNFFGSKLENCSFISCKFLNCSFQFSEVSYNDFHSSTFENCIMEYSPQRKNLFSRCEIDKKSLHYLSKGENRIMPNCKINEYKLDWTLDELLEEMAA